MAAAAAAAASTFDKVSEQMPVVTKEVLSYKAGIADDKKATLEEYRKELCKRVSKASKCSADCRAALEAAQNLSEEVYLDASHWKNGAKRLTPS